MREGYISVATSVTYEEDCRSIPFTQQFRAVQYSADKALQVASAFWFVVAVIGQWMFAFYILSFYGRAVVEGDLARWSKVLSHGYSPGDSIGNFALVLHLFVAVIITIGGPLQLIPQVRARVPVFHRWNGRVYMLTALLASITALYLVWIRGGVFGNVVQHVGISLNAVLIMVCAAMALRYALAGKFDLHRRWALRLFLVVSGAWFIRVGSMLWMILNGSPAAFDPVTFQGPFLNFLAFAQYLLPLAVLELYLRSRDHARAAGKLAMAAGLLVVTIAMGVGIFGATMRLWLPHM
jgi:hypothetical protein